MFIWDKAEIANFDLFINLPGIGLVDGLSPTIEIRRHSDDYFYDFNLNQFSNIEPGQKTTTMSQLGPGRQYRYQFDHSTYNVEETYTVLYGVTYEDSYFPTEEVHSFIHREAPDNATISDTYQLLINSDLSQLPLIYDIVNTNLDMKISDLGFSPENIWAYPNRSLTNPNDYKADVDHLATQASVDGIRAVVDTTATSVGALVTVVGDTNTRLIALDAYIRENSDWEIDNTRFI